VDYFENGKMVDGFIYQIDKSNERADEDSEDEIYDIQRKYTVSMYEENWVFKNISELILDPKYYGGK
jgi:hypothetical protein